MLNSKVFKELAKQIDHDLATPLYAQISSLLEKSIENGRIKAGDRLPPERDLMTLLGVSRRTIRAALASLIQKKMISATRGRGSFILEPATRRSLRFLAPESFTPDHFGRRAKHYDWIHQAEEATFSQTHYAYTPTVAKFREVLRNPPPGHDGMVIYRPPQSWVEELLSSPPELFNRPDFPILVVDRCLAGSPLNWVSTDHHGQTALAVTKLLELGHRRIGFIGGETGIDYLRLAYEGWSDTLKAAQVEPSEKDVLFLKLGGQHGPEFEEKIRPFLENRQFTALVVTGSVYTQSFERACLRCGLFAPEDLSVVVVTEPFVMENLTVRWTAVLNPNEHITLRSLQVLCDLSRSASKGPVQETVAPKFQPGATCRSLEVQP